MIIEVKNSKAVGRPMLLPKTYLHIGSPTLQHMYDFGFEDFAYTGPSNSQEKDGYVKVNGVWTDNIIDKTAEKIQDEIEFICQSLIGFTKQEAKRQIIMILPMSNNSDYRDVEMNLVARMGELLNIKIDFPFNDHFELQALQSIWDGIKAIRARSDLIEFDIVNGIISTEQQIIDAFNAENY